MRRSLSFAQPTWQLVPAALRVTKGAVSGAAACVDVPTFRAVAAGTTGDAAALRFTFRGDSDRTRALASGEMRRQLGLKLRAANGCNVIYVMWRLDPEPALEVSIKRNPGMRTHAECGAGGYTRLEPTDRAVVPVLAIGASHALHAEIAGNTLAAWIDGSLVWLGELPDAAREMTGLSGVRSDNVKYDLAQFSAVASVC